MLAFHLQQQALMQPSTGGSRIKSSTKKSSSENCFQGPESLVESSIPTTTTYFQPVMVHSVSAEATGGLQKPLTAQTTRGTVIDWRQPGAPMDSDPSSISRPQSPERKSTAAFHQKDSVPNGPKEYLNSSSSQCSVSEICRICHCEGTAETPLITPCYCSGTQRYIHQKCLQQWIKASQTRSCEVCRYSFIMEAKVKPFRKWEKLNMSSVERRKVLCSVTFHVIAITCVVWSLYVLIERTAEEIRNGTLEWPFWTKLVVVAIGFTGGLVFMYVQCKMYIQLFRRWKAYNKVIFVQNCP